MHIDDVLPRDAIPSIDDPLFDTSYFGDDTDEIIVVETTPPRAYPVRILSAHEIVNDEISNHGQVDEEIATERPSDSSLPIAVTWCPICASAVVYNRRLDDQVLTFGTSGKLADDALVMYDRETGSEWKQPLGQAISGPLTDRELGVISSPMMTWSEFRSAYPDGVVLQPVRPNPETAYDTSRYAQYDASDEFGLRAMRGEGRERSWTRTDIAAKTPVIGIIHDGDAVGYPYPEVSSAGGLISDTVGGRSILVVSDDGALYAYENPGYEFEIRNGDLYGDGVSWNRTTGESSDGRQLSRIPARHLYAFAWQDDHGPESFYGL